MACLNTSILSMTPIILPQSKEQARVAEIIDSISNAINGEFVRKLKLKLIKTALMQDLLTGKKRVTALLKEPEISRVSTL
jgi:type I restriction enzyme S subunit